MRLRMKSLPGAPRYLSQAHPLHRGRPLIDWDLVMVMEPSTILGALAGGYINKVGPFSRWTVAGAAVPAIASCGRKPVSLTLCPSAQVPSARNRRLSSHPLLRAAPDLGTPTHNPPNRYLAVPLPPAGPSRLAHNRHALPTAAVRDPQNAAKGPGHPQQGAARAARVAAAPVCRGCRSVRALRMCLLLRLVCLVG